MESAQETKMYLTVTVYEGHQFYGSHWGYHACNCKTTIKNTAFEFVPNADWSYLKRDWGMKNMKRSTK